MSRELKFAIGCTLMLLAITPGCPKDSETTEDGGSSTNGSGGDSSSSGPHAGSGGGTASSSSGGHDDGASAESGGKNGGSTGHDAGTKPGDDDPGQDKDGGAAERDAGQGALCDKKCDEGSHCEIVATTQCFRAPCGNTLAQCVPDAAQKFCGGIAAFMCPGAGECVDNPNDDCDPMQGGADCGGICECKKSTCDSGKHWDNSPEVCACVTDTDGTGPKCGDITCPKGKECCDALCGKCVDPGMACTQGC